MGAFSPWEGTLSITGFAPQPLGAPVQGVATIIDNGNGVTLQTLRPLGTAGGSASLLVTDPAAGGSSVAAIRLEASVGFGTLAPFDPLAPAEAPQLTSSQLPIGGVLKLCLLTTSCDSYLAYPLHTPQWDAAVGLGGTITSVDGGVWISIQAAPWTVREAAVTVETSLGSTVELFTEGFVHGPLSFTGSTALTGGEVSLVTPMAIRSSSAEGPQATFGRLTLRFVPEPGFPLLLGSGLAGLALLASQRARRRSRGDSS